MVAASSPSSRKGATNSQHCSVPEGLWEALPLTFRALLFANITLLCPISFTLHSTSLKGTASPEPGSQRPEVWGGSAPRLLDSACPLEMAWSPASCRGLGLLSPHPSQAHNFSSCTLAGGLVLGWGGQFQLFSFCKVVTGFFLMSLLGISVMLLNKTFILDPEADTRVGWDCFCLT